MVYSCRYCYSSLSTASNRTRHEHYFHPDELGLPTFQCSLCELISRKISNLEHHMRTEHSRFTNCCHSCHLGFNETRLYPQHMNSVHSPLLFGEEFEPRDTSTESAFNGLVRAFETTDADEVRDHETFLRAQKPRIENLINEQLCHGPQKVQLCAKLQLIKKHKNQPDNADDERIEIYANSLMTPVYANGLRIAAYWGMLEKMMSILTTFALMGSGWVMKRVLKVDVKFARFRPIRDSSYITLPTKIAACCGLHNIRNRKDQLCFRYCHAAYHLHHGISLGRVDQNYQTARTSPTTYSQPGIHQPLGGFDMTMGFEDILEFEKMKDIKFNLFVYDIGHFLPLKVLLYETYFVMDLIMLYDGDHHHKVLITDLVNVVCHVLITTQANQFFTKLIVLMTVWLIFVKFLHKLARDIHKKKGKFSFFKGDRRILDKFERLFSEV